MQQRSVTVKQKTDNSEYQGSDNLLAMKGIGARLKEARQKAGLTQDQVAKRAGLTQTAISELEAGRSRDTARINELAAAIGRSAEWLRTGKESTLSLMANNEFLPIGRYDTAFSMGPGALVEEHPEPLGYWLIETQWLANITRAAPDSLAIVKASGDSMTPTLLPNDWVLVDRTQTRISREGIYAIRVGDDVWIKRISLNLRDKTVRVISDNPTTPVQEVEESDLAVIGRVISLVARQM